MRKLVITSIVSAVVLVVLAALVASVYAIGNDEIDSKIIQTSNSTVIGQQILFPSGPGVITSYIVTIPVGVETGFHEHDYLMYAYVIDGQITVDYGDRGTKTYLKGDVLVEAMNYSHNGKNAGDIPTKILVVKMEEQK